MTTTYRGATIYANPRNARHVLYSQQFIQIMDMFPDVRWFNVNLAESPWHLRAVINDVVVDAWPSALKAARLGNRAVCGAHEIEDLIRHVRDEGMDSEIELIEEWDF